MAEKAEDLEVADKPVSEGENGTATVFIHRVLCLTSSDWSPTLVATPAAASDEERDEQEGGGEGDKQAGAQEEEEDVLLPEKLQDDDEQKPPLWLRVRDFLFPFLRHGMSYHYSSALPLHRLLDLHIPSTQTMGNGWGIFFHSISLYKLV